VQIASLAIKIRTNHIICSDYVLTSSCVIPTISDTTGLVSDYPVERSEVLNAVLSQYKTFLVESNDE
jgi:hypothetical protein